MGVETSSDETAVVGADLNHAIVVPHPSRSAGSGNPLTIVRSCENPISHGCPPESTPVACAGHAPFTIVHHDASGTLAIGDNLPFMQSLPDGSCDLIYADPPFMTERRRTTGRDAAGFDDRFGASIAAYLAFLRPRSEQMHRLLSERGSLYLHLDWRTVHDAKVMLDGVFGRRNFLNDIIWHYRTGGGSRKWFARKHDTILLYARHAGRHTFHVQRAGHYRTDGLLIDAAGRPFKKTRNGPLYFHPGGPALTDVWDLPFLSTVSRERTGYPTQKPLALLERVIESSSNQNDVVADFFCGSGTTPVAAHRLRRRWIACDAQPAAVRITAGRMNLSLISRLPS
ncbi:MAG: site-specific DNA-methyltransferase [Phycisphaerales bacterium]|nr:site-specific DNA-methyltransferase [Phycisphaerales bacterium]